MSGSSCASEQIDAKENIKPNSEAGLQQHVINERDRCYLLPLKRELINPVIFSPRTPTARERVQSTAKSTRARFTRPA